MGPASESPIYSHLSHIFHKKHHNSGGGGWHLAPSHLGFSVFTLAVGSELLGGGLVTGVCQIPQPFVLSLM